MRENYRGSRSEPAGLRRLRKQVAEAEGGPLELWREKRPREPAWGKKRGKERCGRIPRGKCTQLVDFNFFKILLIDF